MTREMLLAALAGVLAAGLPVSQRAAAQESAGTTAEAGADATQSTQEEDTSAEATAQAESDAAQTQSDAATQGDATQQSQSDGGPALPPPDQPAQQQDTAAQAQGGTGQAQQQAGAAATAQDQQLQQDQQRDQTQQLQQPQGQQLQQQQLQGDRAMQDRDAMGIDADAQGQAGLRGQIDDRELRDPAMRDRDLRDRGMDDRDLRDQQMLGRDVRDRDLGDRRFRGRDARDLNIGIQFGAATGRGLVINSIQPNTVFFDSGLRRGDVLVSVFGQPIRSEVEFMRLVRTYPDQRIPVVVLRDGRQETVYITYEDQMVGMDQPQPYSVYRPEMDYPQTENTQAHLGVWFDTQFPDAAVIRDVTPGTPAEHAGLQPGDAIHSLNGQRVSDYRQAVDLIQSMRPGDRLVIGFSRRVEEQAQALLSGRPAEDVRTATGPEVGYRGEYGPAPQPMYDRPRDVRPGGYYEDPRMFDRDRDRPLLPRLR